MNGMMDNLAGKPEDVRREVGRSLFKRALKRKHRARMVFRRTEARRNRRKNRNRRLLYILVPGLGGGKHKKLNLKNLPRFDGIIFIVIEQTPKWDHHLVRDDRPYDVLGLVKRFDKRAASKRTEADYLRDWECVPDLNERHFEPIKVVAQSHVPRLQQQIRPILRAQTDRIRERQQTRGRLDHGRLHMVLQGKYDVMASKIQHDMVDCCVTLVLDDSHSMRRGGGHGGVTRRDATAHMAYALGSVLEAEKVPFEILSMQHTSRDIYDTPMINPSRPRDYWSLFLYKQFHEKWREVQARLGNYQARGGGTPDPESVAHAVSRQLERRESKKIVFLLSDGEPSVGHMDVDDKLKEDLNDLHQRYAKLGVYVYGIGIQSPHLKNAMGPYAETVNDIDNLTDVAFRQLCKVIATRR